MRQVRANTEISTLKNDLWNLKESMEDEGEMGGEKETKRGKEQRSTIGTQCDIEDENRAHRISL